MLLGNQLFIDIASSQLENFYSSCIGLLAFICNLQPVPMLQESFLVLYVPEICGMLFHLSEICRRILIENTLHVLCQSNSYHDILEFL